MKARRLGKYSFALNLGAVGFAATAVAGLVHCSSDPGLGHPNERVVSTGQKVLLAATAAQASGSQAGAWQVISGNPSAAWTSKGQQSYTAATLFIDMLVPQPVSKVVVDNTQFPSNWPGIMDVSTCNSSACSATLNPTTWRSGPWTLAKRVTNSSQANSTTASFTAVTAQYLMIANETGGSNSGQAWKVDALTVYGADGVTSINPAPAYNSSGNLIPPSVDNSIDIHNPEAGIPGHIVNQFGWVTTSFYNENGAGDQSDEATWPPSQAIDHDGSTRFSSDFTDGAWFQIDLGSVQSFDELYAFWEGSAYPVAFKVQQSSDGATWTDLKQVNDFQSGIDCSQAWADLQAADASYVNAPTNSNCSLADLTNLNGSGRYIRFQGESRHGQYGYSFWEFVALSNGNPLNLSNPPALVNPGHTTASGASFKRGGAYHLCGWSGVSAGLNDIQALSGSHSGGTSWTYSWSDHVGNCVGNSDLANNGIEFVPMVWGITNTSCVAGTTGSGECTYSEDAVDTGVTTQAQNTKETILSNIGTTNNGTVKWLLGYNEPDFQFQSDLTPKQAASHWADLEWIANVNKTRSSSAATLGLVGPAVNFCDSTCATSNAGCCTVVNDANVSGQMPASGAREQIFRWLEHFYDECQTTFTIPKDGGGHTTYNGAAGHNCQIDAQAVHSYSWYGIWSVTPLQQKAGDLGGLPTHCTNLVTDADEDGTDCGGEDCMACDPNVKAMFHRLSQQVWVTEFAPTTDDCNYANCENDHVKNADKYIDNWVNLNGAPGTGNTALEADSHVTRFAWFMPKVNTIPSLNNGSLLQAVTNTSPTPFNPVPSGQTVCPANDSASGVANTLCQMVGKKYATASWNTSCTPNTCASVGANCGSMVDGCGGILYCGTCSTGTCGYGGNANVCGGGTQDAGADSGSLTALSRTGWTAVGSPTNGSESAMFDGSSSTRWDTQANQVSGDVLTVDMKASQTFSQITLDSFNYSAPAATFNLDVSTNNSTWTNVVTNGTGPSSGRQTITFSAKTARYIRITLESSLSHYWSVAEFNVWH